MIDITNIMTYGKEDLLDNVLVNNNPLCIGNPRPPKLYGTRKVVQLTGDIDCETGESTINQTGKHFGIYGTDLGVSFVHDGKLYFLFGDTNRGRPPSGLPLEAKPGEDFNEAETDYDSIAYTSSDHAYEGIKLVFNSDFPHVDGIDQMTGEHPIEGTSIDEYMYLYFTTDLFPNNKVPTRTVLARSKDGGYHFGKPLYTLSTDKFIHVSAQTVKNDKISGMPYSAGKGLLIWGSGKHRKSDIFLAYVPLDKITNKSALLFFAGFDYQSSKPIWESQESMARPLFQAGCVGELSVRWNYYLGKWIMLYNCELCNTSGIIVRLADNPWGPWSAPKIIFDPDDAYGKYMHIPGQDNLHDSGRDGPNDRGNEYGPYQMTPYCTGVKGRYTKIYFTMSTWNPYQVVQMSAIITSDEEDSNPRPYFNHTNNRNDRKYAYLSVLMAHIANTKRIKLKNFIQCSSYMADHIEWAQFHSYVELRSELEDKFMQLITKLESDEQIIELYNTIAIAIIRLGEDNDGSFRNELGKWILNTVDYMGKEYIIDKIVQLIHLKQFLHFDDHLCYAYDSDDANEFKYARVSLLESKLGNDVGIQWDFAYQGSLDFRSHIAWARFRSVEVLRQEILNKFRQIVYKFSSLESIANAYIEIDKAISEVSSQKLHGVTNYSVLNKSTLYALNGHSQEYIIKDLANKINCEEFLESLPV
jgi:Domain of unknown function (DUF4185)